MDVYNNMENHMVHLSQAQYIKTTLKEYQHYITKYNIGEYDSPMDNRTPYGKYQCPVPDLQEAQEMKIIPYRELIGTLLWIANGISADIAHAVGTLTKFTINPGIIH
jgi:hypothetical protein